MIDKIGEMCLEIECIGPSHGAIWRTPEGIATIIGSYKGWTRFEAPPRVALFLKLPLTQRIRPSACRSRILNAPEPPGVSMENNCSAMSASWE